MRELVIHQSGPAASIQDSGRTGCLQLGIPPAGAMDADALASEQYLLGHSADEAAIEMAYGNLVASPTEPCHIAVTGAAVDLRINGMSARMHTVLRVEAGQQIQITLAQPASTAISMWTVESIHQKPWKPKHLGKRGCWRFRWPTPDEW